MKEVYDLIIIGAGPAGLSAGLYGARAKLNVLIVEKEKSGGQIVMTEEVANYPGSIENASGPSLTARMVQQADAFGAERTLDTITEVQIDGKIKVLKGEKRNYKAKAVIIATGAKSKPIGCPGEKEFTGKGVSYCATCDADFFTDLEVFVVGGGDAAVEEAMYLTKFARKVTIIHRRDKLRAAKSIQEKAFKNPKIQFLWNAAVKEIKGDGVVQSMIVKNTITGEEKEIFADEDDGTFGIFVFIGYNPVTQLFEGILDMERGYIKTDENMKTNIPGVFAAGDCRVKSLRQVVTATSDGAIAAVEAEKYIADTFDV
ncbi:MULTISPECIES: thioredoxin-disulfide reductase [Tissierellales]|jgi:thioredoxin reductase (NADPH)|uniref:Thioredoxin reductase n=1 Tax=Acidilutibacter cellobiosedens TaxID=2507161 RepID=A0A410QEM1_9FIRM|nr:MULTISPECIES: thioredoxin-disulfide reductase [Tissierellales]MBE6081624.1 thioredoxin-disulfide reductase [Tissierellaceae bacterium]QAT62430.1 thioredoxin-disulfide reductase [Acidilutibacter cellobiosedens]SCL89116.1 Thioredoxin reductase [Sporanaerobacter sp. PP17-6a]